METPLHAAAAVQEMLLQSWGDRIRIFPAVPGAWPDISFHDLRAEGAFLVSAVRKDGKASWVRIKSLAGEACLLDTDLENPKALLNGEAADLRRRPDGLFELVLAAGDEIVLGPPGIEAFRVSPVSRPGGEHPFGLKR